MMCSSNHVKSGKCSCQKGFSNNLELWSKRKKISVLENCLSCLEVQIDEIKEALSELKE